MIAAGLLACALLIAPSQALADSGDHKVTSDVNKVVVEAWKSKHNSQKHKVAGQPTRSNQKGRSRSSFDQDFARYQSRLAAYKQYRELMAGWNRCAAAGCPKPPAAVAPPGEPPSGTKQTNGSFSAVPTATPEQAAYAAIAQLRLTAPKPVIGPSPEINEWDIAAVGYPYWLWAEGNLDPAPVSTTVADLTVRLDAHLQSTTFDLGDGSRLTCNDLTKRWSRAVEPAAPSPACGHTYTKPSLPKGKYRITAYSTWAVDWSVNGVGGTIPLYQQASTSLPVGELQVLTH